MPLDLLQLQNLCKRDPPTYQEEFLLQLQHWNSQLAILKLNPSTDSKDFGDLTKFISQVASVYPQQSKEFPEQLCNLLEEHAYNLKPELRKVIVWALILIRNRHLITPTRLLSLFFKLFRVPDKGLRKDIYAHIVSDIKNANKKTRQHNLNRTLQNFMYGMIQDESEIAARKSVDVMIELYKKGVWNDEKTVNIIASAALSKSAKIKVKAMNFFLGVDEDKNDDKILTVSQVQKKYATALKTGRKNKRKRQFDKEMAKAKKEREKEIVNPNFPAIDLINDPQSYAKKVFKMLKGGLTEKFIIKVLTMNFLSRLIAHHQLILLNFYPYMSNYLRTSQEEITPILAILAQSIHSLLPPETVEPLIRKLVDNFVGERSMDSAVVVGLNTVREICLRCPFVMNEALMRDLAQYKGHRNKGVVMAARSLIRLYREVNPALLAKADRGRPTDVVPLQYGENRPADRVPGAELLEKVDLLVNEDEEEPRSKRQKRVKEAMSEDEGDNDDDSNDEEEVEDGEEESGESGDNEGEESDSGEHGAVGPEHKSVSESDRSESISGDAEPDPAVVQPKQPNKRPIEAVRFLTEEDFDNIERLKEMEADRMLDAQISKRHKIDDDEPFEVTDTVNPLTIWGKQKRPKDTKEERIASIMSGREDRPQFGSKKGRKEKKPGQSTSNTEKKKTKAFILTLQSKAMRSKKRGTVAPKSRSKKKNKKAKGRGKQF